MAIKYTRFVCGDLSLKILKAVRGSSDFQTSFEYLTLFMVAVTFDEVLSTTWARIRRDNLEALNDALSLNFTAPGMTSIGRELAWRRIVRRWELAVGTSRQKLTTKQTPCLG